MAKKGNKVAAGMGLAALAAAAGAYYFYGSKHSAQHRRQMKSWIVKAKGEVMERMENMRELSQEAYENAVNQVIKKYEKLKDVSPKELIALRKELQGHWKRISVELKSSPAKRKPSKSK